MNAGHPADDARLREAGATPSSAAGFLEPYGARVLLHPRAQTLEAEGFLEALLERVAAGCVREGASVIGHLKCLMRAGDRRLRCNLSSTRSGAVCEGAGSTPIDLADGAELDLAVLVYGLPATVIDDLVGSELDGLLGPAGLGWSKQASFHSSGEPHGDCPR